MTKPGRRKCLHCHAFFHPDPRTRQRQRYCSSPACRRASKAASQRRWMANPANRDYFRGPEQVARVQAWRAAHPGYWRRPAHDPLALQEECPAQPLDCQEKSPALSASPLQDLYTAQPLVLMGLIAHLTGTALQEDIASATRGFRQLAQDILGAGSLPASPEPPR